MSVKEKDGPRLPSKRPPLPPGGAAHRPPDPGPGRLHTPAFPSSSACPKLPFRDSLPVRRAAPCCGGDQVPAVAAALHTRTGGFQTWRFSVQGDCLRGWNFTLESTSGLAEVAQGDTGWTGRDGSSWLFQLPALLLRYHSSPFWVWAAGSLK